MWSLRVHNPCSNGSTSRYSGYRRYRYPFCRILVRPCVYFCIPESFISTFCSNVFFRLDSTLINLLMWGARSSQNCWDLFGTVHRDLTWNYIRPNRPTLEVLAITWHPMISYRVDQSSFLRKFMLVCTRSMGSFLIISIETWPIMYRVLNKRLSDFAALCFVCLLPNKTVQMRSN